MDFAVKNKNSINFLANKRKTSNGNEYNHSNKALIAGVGTCALATGLSSLPKTRSKKTTLAWLGLTAPLILMGAIADKLTNKERQKTADLVAEVGADQALLIDNKLKVSENGKIYKPTGNATLVSTIGLAGILAVSGISHLLFKKGIVKNEIFKHIGAIFDIFIKSEPTDEIEVLIAAFPAILPMLPLVASDLVNNQQAKKKS